MRNLVSGMILAVIVVFSGGLLLVAVVKVRAAAARISCQNNLHQIEVSVQNYESAHGHFPQAALPNSSLPVEKRLSWMVEIGPYIESDPLWHRITLEKPWDAEENRFASLTFVNMFQCAGYPDRPPENMFAPTHYIGVAGIGLDAAELPKDDPRTGFFGYERKLAPGDIPARTLLMAMETSRASGAWTAAGWATVRGLEEETPYLGIEGQFGGNHPGVANAVFADGSVRSLRESMDPRVLEAIATVKGSAGVGSIDE